MLLDAAADRGCGSCSRRARSRRSGLHRLRLAGELTELRGPDLRFSLDETRALARAGGITLSDTGVGAAARTHRGLAGRSAPGGDLADRAPGPRALRVRVLGQRADRGRLSPGRGAGAPAAGGARPAPAHVDPRARQRPAGRRAHRRHGGRGDPPAARSTRTPSSPRSTPPARGSATTTCSPICCASSCGASRRRRSRRCTAPRPRGTKSRATSSKPSATLRQPVTGRRPAACSWTTTSR